MGAFAPAVAQPPDLAGIDVKELAEPLAPLFDEFCAIDDDRRGQAAAGDESAGDNRFPRAWWCNQDAGVIPVQNGHGFALGSRQLPSKCKVNVLRGGDVPDDVDLDPGCRHQLCDGIEKTAGETKRRFVVFEAVHEPRCAEGTKSLGLPAIGT